MRPPVVPHFSLLRSFPFVQISESLMSPALVACACVLWLVGCGESKGTVNGVVTFNGEPVKSGMVAFVKSDGPLVREGAVITNGTFHASLSPGEYKIELNAQ